MKNLSFYKHLSLDERKIILKGIENGSTKLAIAQNLGKNLSTICKEIKNHRSLSSKCSLPLECANYKKCHLNRKCTPNCPDFKLFTCSRRDRSPGCCNGCPNYLKCRFNKFSYNPNDANYDYLYNLSNSRIGINLTNDEIKTIALIIKPLIMNGLSPYQIVSSHPELNISESSLYNYISIGVFREYGVFNVHLRRKVSRKLPKNKQLVYKKRKNNKFLLNRTYKDFNDYISLNETSFIVEMDTVYNNVSTGPFIQTFTIRGTEFIFAILHDKCDSISMVNGINYLDEKLGHNIFNKYFNIILTDRGSEFALPEKIEYRDDNTLRTRVFFCDPMQANQKGCLEKKHEMLRYILPKKTNFSSLGLLTQDDLNLAISHINSTPVKSLNGKTPFQYLKFMYNDLYKAFIKFELKEIPPDKIILKPYLLKK